MRIELAMVQVIARVWRWVGLHQGIAYERGHILEPNHKELREVESRRVLVEWNQTQADYPHTRCIHELFEEQAHRTPDKVALVCGERQLTYRQFNEQVDRLAGRLRRLGVGPEMLVGVCAERSLEMVTALFAIHKAGGAYVPMDPSYPRERLAFMLEDAQVAVLVTQQAFRDTLPQTQAPTLCLDAPATETPPPPRATPAAPGATPDNLAYVLYTSGSTGKPKGVMVRHRNVVSFFTGMDRALGCEPGVWLAVTSISFDISVLELFWTLTRGFTVVLHEELTRSPGPRTPPSTPAPGTDQGHTLGEQLRRHGVTHLQCTPSLAALVAQEPGTREALRGLRQFLLGGEPLPPSLASQLHGCGQLFNMYGPTETTVWSTVHRVDDTSSIPIGRPIANTQVYLLDGSLKPVPVGEAGELFIGGAGVTRGYLHRPDLTAERFLPDPFSSTPGARFYRTGDLARYQPDGTIEFLGRADQQVKIRGFRIELGEIEAALREHPGVKESAVSVWQPSPEDKRLAGYYVPNPGQHLSAAELRRFLRNKLPESMVPAALVPLEALPLTPNGKLDRKALPVPQGAPHLPLTEAQREIWYAAQMSDTSSCAFNLSVSTRLRGKLELPRLEEGLRWLARRHEALRVSFAPTGDSQQVHPALKVELDYEDYSHLPVPEQEQRLDQALRATVSRPFDLACGPLWRAQILRLGPEEHLLVLTAHHLICDGASLNILLQELARHYSAGVRGEVPPSGEATSFSAFVAAQAAAGIGPERAAAEAFWLAQYAEPAPVLELPTDCPRPLARDYNGGSRRLRLSRELSRALKGFSASQRCTVTTTLLASYYLLLQRLSGQSDLVVGLPMTSRNGESGELLVGLCLNFLPLRWKLEGDPRFVEHLQRVRQLLVEAHQHHNFTLGTLLQKLNLPRTRNRPPLVSAMFNLSWVCEEPQFESLQTETAANPYCYTHFDLSFSLEEHQGRLELECQYGAELFDPETIQGWLEHYQSLLATLTADPGQHLSALAESIPAPVRLVQGSEEPRPAVGTQGDASETTGELTEVRLRPSALTPTESVLAQIWREVIVTDQVGREDNFFDLGGHSLLATQVLARINANLHVELPLRAIFEAPTLAGLAQTVDRAQREAPVGAPLIRRRDRNGKARELKERLHQLSDGELQDLLQNLNDALT